VVADVSKEPVASVFNRSTAMNNAKVNLFLAFYVDLKALNIMAKRSFETSATTQPTTQRHILSFVISEGRKHTEVRKVQIRKS
jgi:hypothetical protein